MRGTLECEVFLHIWKNTSWKGEDNFFRKNWVCLLYNVHEFGGGGGGGLIIGLIAFLLEAGLCWVQLSIWGIQVWEEGVDIATIVSHCIY